MQALVMLLSTLFLDMRISATSRPSGSENSSVRKKMAQVRPRPSLILAIIAVSVIEQAPYVIKKGAPVRRAL